MVLYMVGVDFVTTSIQDFVLEGKIGNCASMSRQGGLVACPTTPPPNPQEIFDFTAPESVFGITSETPSH